MCDERNGGGGRTRTEESWDIDGWLFNFLSLVVSFGSSIVGSGLNWLCFLSPLFGPDNLLGGLYIGTYRFFSI